MRLTRAFVLCGGLALLLAAAALAQGPGGVEGYWQGKVKIGGVELRVVFHLERKMGELTGTLDSPDQGAKGIPITKAEFKDGVVRVEVKSIDGVYTGKLQDGGKALEYLKGFGSVTVLNGHIHQVMQKVEGNVTFHTARSTAFPQPAPGTAPSPGPMKVADDKLRTMLGIASVNFKHVNQPLAIIDTPLVG